MDNIRFLLVIALAMISYMLWEAWQLDYGPKPSEVAVVEQPTISNSKQDLPGLDPVQQAETKKNVEAVPALEIPSDKIITVKTDVVSVEIDAKGGTIRKLDLLQYPHEKVNTVVNKVFALVGLEPPEKDLSPIRLFDSNVDNLFLAQSGLIAGNNSVAAPDHHATFSIEKENYQLTEGQDTLSVPLVWTNNEGLVVTKTFTFSRNSYNISVEQKVSNDSLKTWTGRQYGQLLRIPFVDDKGNTFIRTYAGGVVYTEEEKYQKVDYDDMAEENLDVTSIGGWSAMTQHYFASAWIPPPDQENNFYTKALKDSRFVIGSYSHTVSVPPHTDTVFSSHLFAGPKIQPMMAKVAEGLELTVDFGWLLL